MIRMDARRMKLRMYVQRNNRNGERSARGVDVNLRALDSRSNQGDYTKAMEQC